MKKLLRIGTRSSKLALWQANYVKDFLEKNFDNLEIELKKILTTGDKNLKDNIESFGGKSVFVKEIEESLLNDDIDLAVHSYKDLPVILPEGLEIISTSNREDPRDVLISKNNENLQRLFDSLQMLSKNYSSKLFKNKRFLIRSKFCFWNRKYLC